MDHDADLATTHENGIAAFLVPARAARFRATIGNPRGRARICSNLAHNAGDFDKRWAMQLPSSTSGRDIVKLLREHGASDRCYVLSEDREVDGRIFPLAEAVETTVTAFGAAVISCIPSRLGLFVDEDPGGQWLLRRAASSQP